MRIKICGLMRSDQALAIAQKGATALGFICVPTSPRYISAAEVRIISQDLIQANPSVDRIGIFVDAPLEKIDQTVSMAYLTGVQLHGQESPQFCQQVRQALPQVEIIKAIRVKSPESLRHLERYQAGIDTLLLDAYHPQMPGGTGQRLPWSSLQGLRPSYPWFLAGGLTPDNILEALQILQPDGIDLSSGLEQAPGNKDLAKVDRLFDQLRLQPRSIQARILPGLNNP
ncbi:N-(5'-phosphoribosyl)anthranilate isomerase [Leptolyngbya sp. 'hensonii']|uniref:phosphoribosylanthranilate isomerase n=1 Tax=Leptolyngbya sp. 'hensonii' TaxID=1922337 RepID=UPI0009502E79|nr:phosphoribosylanthranilate isomerase [Leptolyngbya sp. 'hensonii']OLP17598.1 N-(5'-phosphoribosyl)anthranilate isomerase [Leptolyngbya sp. 'hensonii']